MCKISLLHTTQTNARKLEKRSCSDMMAYKQIQYYNDCIRAYAMKKNTPIDVAFQKIEAEGMLPIIEDAYQSGTKVFITVRRMQKKQNNDTALSRNRCQI